MTDLASRISPDRLTAFVAESNSIEGITREVRVEEQLAHLEFLRGPADMFALIDFVRRVAPHNRLRLDPGLDVRVGRHIAPPGGPTISPWLGRLLLELDDKDPFDVHREYLHLHPFTDGNGRSARVLWLHMMLSRDAYVPDWRFLHHFYYQSLGHFDRGQGAGSNG